MIAQAFHQDSMLPALRERLDDWAASSTIGDLCAARPPARPPGRGGEGTQGRRGDSGEGRDGGDGDIVGLRRSASRVLVHKGGAGKGGRDDRRRGGCRSTSMALGVRALCACACSACVLYTCARARARFEKNRVAKGGRGGSTRPVCAPSCMPCVRMAECLLVCAPVLSPRRRPQSAGSRNLRSRT